jgi:ribonuclease D
MNAICNRARLGYDALMHVITTTSALADACQRLARHPFVTVDTEFLREETYWPELCLIQMASAEEALIVDPLAAGIDLGPFYELMAHPGTVKVFHAGRQDVEIVFNQGKLIPQPIFDTQVAAMVCGFGESVSYGNLVKRVNGADIDKSSRFTDWSRRPLSETQLVYALGDVTHLREIYLHLKKDLETSGRAGWLAEEMATLTDPKTYLLDPKDAWTRLKLRVKSRKALGTLMELASWRERQAQAQNVPRARILRDEALYDIANRMPKDVTELGQLRTLSDGFSRSQRGRDLIEVVKRGLERDPKTVPPLSNGSAPSAEAMALMDLLKVLLKSAAARHGVAAKLISDTEDLEAIATQKVPDVAALKGWRREMFGEDALRLKTGEVALTVKDGEVVTVALAGAGKA